MIDIHTTHHVLTHIQIMPYNDVPTIEWAMNFTRILVKFDLDLPPLMIDF